MRRVAVLTLTILCSWALLSWWGERGQRLALEEAVAGPTPREVLQEKRIRELGADKLRLEQDLLRAERAKQRAIENLTVAVQRLKASETRKSGKGTEDPEKREQELTTLRENLELVRRLNRSLRMNGGGWIRILSLDERKGKELRGVMLSVVGEDGLNEGAYLASTCRLHMDRATGRVWLVLGKGTRFVRRKKLPFDDGLELSFEGHWPKLFAQDLHDYLALEGDWPKPKAAPRPNGDLKIIAMWRERLDAFFEALSVHGPRLELQDLGGVGLGDFEGVSLFGYSKKGLLERRMKAAKLEFWVDKARDRVELRLTDGYVEDDGGRVDFPKKTWQVVLPGMGAQEAQKLLAGFVRHVGSTRRER